MTEYLEQFYIYARSVWGHRWIAMLVAWTVALGGWVWAYHVPNKYEATARVFIDTDSVLRPLLKGIAIETDQQQQRLQLMTRTLLSRPNIEKLVRATDLDLSVSTPQDKEALIANLETAINIQGGGKGKGNNNLYTISYDNSDPGLAKKVVQGMINILMENSLGDTREDSTSALAFLDKQIKDYEVKLTSSEDRLAEFKRQNLAYLPGQEGNYYSDLRKIQDQYQGAQLDLQESIKRRDSIKKQMDDFRKVGVVTDANGTIILTPTQKRIQILQAKLDDLRLRYTDNHPDVKELRLQIAALEKQSKEEEKMTASGDAARFDNNPMYQQLSLALGKVESDISAAQVRVKEFADRVSGLKQQIEKLQNVEVKLNRLDRNYSLNKENYNALVKRREAATLAGAAEQTGKGIQFRMIDPPFVPDKPIGPNRLLLYSSVFFLAILGGIGVAFVVAQYKPTFYGRKMLQQVTGVSVFGGVSKIESIQEASKRRKDKAMYITAGVLLSGFFVMVVLSGRIMSNISTESQKVDTKVERTGS